MEGVRGQPSQQFYFCFPQAKEGYCPHSQQGIYVSFLLTKFLLCPAPRELTFKRQHVSVPGKLGFVTPPLFVLVGEARTSTYPATALPLCL